MALSPSQAAIVTVIAAILFILVTLVVTAGDPDPSTSASRQAPEAAAEAESDGVERANVGAVVAGFGLLVLWAAGGAFVLVRARQRRDSAQESSAHEGG